MSYFVRPIGYLKYNYKKDYRLKIDFTQLKNMQICMFCFQLVQFLKNERKKRVNKDNEQ